MSVDVNNLGKYLAKLTDQQLRAYARMHKANPYVVSLASYEASNRKEKRDAQLAQQGQVPQSKVVDTAIANMAAPMPEDQGIAKLPAGDMNFADGGIVAFAGNGSSQLVKDNPAAMSVLTPLQDAVLVAKQRYEAAVNSRDPQSAQLYLQQLSDAQKRLSAAAQQQFGEGTAAQAMTAAQEASVPAAPAAARTGTPPMPNAAQNIGSTFTPGGESGLRPEVSAAPNQVANAQERGLGAAARAAGVGSMDVEGLTRRALEEAGKKPHPQAKELEALGKERIAAAEENAKGIEAINKQFEDIYKGREERLNKREGDISTMRDQHLGLALLQAGASMMTTPGGIGTAIGKGIDVGSKQYATGIERVRAAQEKLYDARDRLEELNAQRGELSAREQLKAKNEIRNAGIGAREDLIKANMDIYKVNHETALKMVDNQIKLGIAQMQENRADARAGRPGETLQITQEYDRIMTEKGQAAADAFLERVGVVKGLGKADPALKDPKYISAVKEAERAQMLANSTTDPAKKAQRQADADNAWARANALLRPSNQSAAKVNSGGTSQSPVIDWSSIK